VIAALTSDARHTTFLHDWKRLAPRRCY
jgi:hypothetical protein